MRAKGIESCARCRCKLSAASDCSGSWSLRQWVARASPRTRTSTRGEQRAASSRPAAGGCCVDGAAAVRLPTAAAPSAQLAMVSEFSAALGSHIARTRFVSDGAEQCYRTVVTKVIHLLGRRRSGRQRRKYFWHSFLAHQFEPPERKRHCAREGRGDAVRKTPIGRLLLCALAHDCDMFRRSGALWTLMELPRRSLQLSRRLRRPSCNMLARRRNSAERAARRSVGPAQPVAPRRTVLVCTPCERALSS